MAGLVGQTGFFPGDRRLRELDLLGDGLPLLNRLIPWERFRPILESVPKAKPKGPGGRKPYDRMLLFKMMVLQQLHNLSDEQTEYQVRDRLSFQRFLGLGLEEAVPDNTTLWLFRESLAQAKLTERLFTAFHAFLREAGYAARAGQIIDASFVTVPRQRMHRKEREQVNQGETPQTWQDQPAKRRQKDTDARWTKKNGRSFFGYKNHINVDKRHKLIHQYMVTDAAVHGSASGPGESGRTGFCGQRLSFNGSGANAMSKRLPQPNPREGATQPPLDQGPGVGQHAPVTPPRTG